VMGRMRGQFAWVGPRRRGRDLIQQICTKDRRVQQCGGCAVRDGVPPAREQGWVVLPMRAPAPPRERGSIGRRSGCHDTHGGTHHHAGGVPRRHRDAYWTSGDGPPLVLVHGTTADHTRWAPVLKYLEPHVTVHAMRVRRGDADLEHPQAGAVRGLAHPEPGGAGHPTGASGADGRVAGRGRVTPVQRAASRPKPSD